VRKKRSRNHVAMSFPFLPRAPIIEGLINIQVKPRPGLTLQDLSKFGERLKASYPTTKELRDVQAQLMLGPNHASSQSVAATHVGFRYERQTPPFVVHARLNELLVSRLRPYETWEKLQAEAQTVWSEYRTICQPEVITRVATRYINRVELPIEGLNFDDYLTAPPLIPKALTQKFEGFLTKIVVPHAESGAHIAMSQMLDDADPKTGKVPVLIDIDVYKEVEFPVDSPEAWELLGKMRDLKNHAFFDSLTSKALELFR